jgi:hypothetical protein
MLVSVFLLNETSATILGSGTTLKEGTMIKLTGINCNVTLLEDLEVDKLEINPDHFSLSVSIPPTYILNLPYTYSSGLVDVFGIADTSTVFSVSTSVYGNGIKVYEVSSPAYLTSVSWDSLNQIISIDVNAPFGEKSIIKVYWPYDLPPLVECRNFVEASWDFDSLTKIVTLNATHASTVTWDLQVQSEVTTTTTTTVPITTTTIPKGGGCPILKVWDGKEFVRVEKLDIHSESGDTTYSTSFKMKPFGEKTYRLILEEALYALWEGSHIDYVELTDQEGRECKLIRAEHSKLGDVTDSVEESDDSRVETKPGESIELTFTNCEGNEFKLKIEGYNPWWHFVKLGLSLTNILIIIITFVILILSFFAFRRVYKFKPISTLLAVAFHHLAAYPKFLSDFLN